MRCTSPLRIAATFVCVLACFSARADDDTASPSFSQWLSSFKEEARQEGISGDVLDEAFRDVEPIDRVLELDQSQPEVKFTLNQYLKRLLTTKMIAQARARYQENRDLLEEIGDKYGVQPQYIVALWGIETRYGAHMGDFDTVAALATLAFDGRRSQYFRGELIKALRILDEKHVKVHEMKGSWAGAMGQCQFMPSSFLKYAVDYNGDGRKDIWDTESDVFASIANYLHSEGWDPEKGWGTKAHPKNNFNVLLKWNRSRYFATAVGMLADAIVRGTK